MTLNNSPQNVADRGAGLSGFPAPRFLSPPEVPDAVITALDRAREDIEKLTSLSPQESADQALAVDREIRTELRRTLKLKYGRAKGL